MALGAMGAAVAPLGQTRMRGCGGRGSGKVPETPQTLGVTPLLGTTRFKLQVKGSLTVDTLRVLAEGAARRHSTRHTATQRRLHQGLPLLATHPGSSPGKGPNSPMVGQGPHCSGRGPPGTGPGAAGRPGCGGASDELKPRAQPALRPAPASALRGASARGGAVHTTQAAAGRATPEPTRGAGAPDGGGGDGKAPAARTRRPGRTLREYRISRRLANSAGLPLWR